MSAVAAMTQARAAGVRVKRERSDLLLEALTPTSACLLAMETKQGRRANFAGD